LASLSDGSLEEPQREKLLDEGWLPGRESLIADCSTAEG